MVTIYRVDRTSHDKLMSLVNENFEVGGSMKRLGKTVTIDTIHTTGQYDEVAIPFGLVQFHSHPRFCTTERCALPIPSASDLS